MQGASTIIQAMISKNASLSAAVDIKVGEMGALLTKVFNVSLPNCKLEDMLEQWISAIAIKLPLPKLVVPELKVVALGALIPGFKLPCLVLPGGLLSPFTTLIAPGHHLSQHLLLYRKAFALDACVHVIKWCHHPSRMLISGRTALVHKSYCFKQCTVRTTSSVT